MTDNRAFEEPDDQLHDWEYPEEDEGDEVSETIPCPNCGADVYEDAEQCPVCGEFILPGAGRLWAGRSAWWVLLGLLGTGAVLWVLLTGGL